MIFLVICFSYVLISKINAFVTIRGPQPQVGPYNAEPRDCLAYPIPTGTRKFVYDSKLEDRQMWNFNAGYCGETSFVMASLKYGAYFSQYDIRDIAVLQDVPHQSGGDWYDLSMNDQATTRKCGMTSNEFFGDGKTRHGKLDVDTYDFIAWIKEMMRKNYAVTIGVYMNHALIYNSTDPEDGFHANDHYVTVTKYESDFDDDEYHENDIITIADHEVYPKNPFESPPCYFTYIVNMAGWISNRTEANNPATGYIYTLPQRSFSVRNFGIAQTGIIDINKECLPVTVATDKNFEQPQIKPYSEERPKPMPLVLTITVSNVEDGVDYIIYRYDDEKKIPTHSFNKNKANAKEIFEFKGDTSTKYQLIQNIMSDDKCIYRAVRADSN